MLKWLWQIFKFIIPTIFVIALHLFFINFLPYPFNNINTIYFAVLWLIMISSKINFFLLGLAALFVSELFSGLPFGITSASMLISLIIAHWFLLNIFTNRSLYMVFLSTFIGLIIYRILFFIILAVWNLFSHVALWPGAESLAEIAWEIALTPCALLIFYLLASKLTKRLDPNYIALSKGKIYG